MLGEEKDSKISKEIIITLIISIILVFTIHSSLKFGLKTNDPLVVVVSGSMEPTFERGDVLILKNGSDIEVGDVVTYSKPGEEIPIVHRVRKIVNKDGKEYYVTWGDNNAVPDTYKNENGKVLPGVPEKAIENEAVLVIPKVGYFSLWIRGRWSDDCLTHTCLWGCHVLWFKELLRNLISRNFSYFLGDKVSTDSGYQIPSLTVDAIIKYEKGIILIKRDNEPFKGDWALPGGFVEYGEKVENAVKREAKEETGLDVAIKDLVGVYSEPDRDPRRHTVSICFLVEGKGDLNAGSDASTAIKKSFNQIPQNLAFDHGKMIKDAINNYDL